MFKIFGYLKNSIPQVLLIIVLLIIQAWGDLTLPQYTSDIVDIGIQNGGIENAAADALSVDGYNALETFMNDEQKSILAKSYTLVKKGEATDSQKERFPASADNDVYFLNELTEDEKQQLINTVDIPMTAAEMTKELSFEDLSSMTEKQGIKLPFTSFEQAGEMLGISSGKANALTIITALAEKGGMGDTDLSALSDKISEMPGTITEQSAVRFVKDEYLSLGVDMNVLQQNYLLSAGGKMLLIALLMMAVSVTVGFFAATTAAKVGRDLRAGVFRNVVSFSSAEIDRFSTASLITRSTNDIQQIQMVTTMMLRMVLYAPIVGIGGIIKVAQTKSGMEWVIAIAVAAIMVFIFTLVGIAMPKFKIMQSLVDKVNLVSREILTGLSVIRAFGREKEEEKRFDEANRELTRTQLFTNRVMTFMMPGMSMIMYCITLGIVWIAAGRIDKGSMQVGTMTAFITYAMMIVMSFLMLSAMSIMLPRAGVAAERIDEVIRTNSTVNDPKEPVTEADHRGVIRFNHVDFRYPGAKEDVLSDIDFVAEPGKITAIIGSTGCGKSTLVNLIPRFYDVTGGSIELDGHDIRDYTLSELRESIGFVPQKGILFSGTIASNLRFGKADASDEQIKKAADIAQASEFIETKNDRYDSSIAQGGSNVSGGQKQRLAIARAIAKDPHIYVFDDSFSALDMKTDARLRAALSEVTENASVIIVAQRISTIIHADQILVLDDGKIVGKGTHEELLKNCDVYMQIAQSQLSAKELGLDDKVAETATDKAADTATKTATDTSAVSGLDNEKEGM